MYYRINRLNLLIVTLCTQLPTTSLFANISRLTTSFVSTRTRSCRYVFGFINCTRQLVPFYISLLLLVARNNLFCRFDLHAKLNGFDDPLKVKAISREIRIRKRS